MNKSFLAACAFALLGLLPACSPASSQSGRSAKQPQLAKKLMVELLVQEQKDPQRYLATTGASYRTPQGKLVLQGHLVSTATFANYKDPVILVTWFSKNYTRLGTKEYPVQALVKAQDAVAFKFETDAPSTVVSVGLGITTAAAAGIAQNGLL